MTKEWYKKNKHIIDAWAEGKTIQVKGPDDDEWTDVDCSPTWNRYCEYRIKPEIKFPIYAKRRNAHYYVKFVNYITGTVIGIDCQKQSLLKVGHKGYNWPPVTDEKTWKIIPNPYELRDKDPVLCWDDEYKCIRHIKFWDARNKCTFSHGGNRGGALYKHYKKILPWEETEYIKEMRRYLED